MRFIILSFLFLPFSTHAQEGYLQVTTNLDNYYLVVNHDYENVALHKRNDKITLQAGFNHIRLIWEGMNDFEQVILIQEDQVFELRPVIDFDDSPKRSSLNIIRNFRNLTIYSDEYSSIYVNDTYLGTGVIAGMLNPGNYQLKLVHPESGTSESEFTIRPGKHYEIFRFNEQVSSVSLPFKLIPGVGYYNNGETGKAIATWMGTTMLFFNVWVQNRSYNRAYNIYDELVIKYNAETRTDRFPALRNDINTQLETLDNRKFKFNIALIATGAFYAYTTYRGFQKPKKGYSLNRKREQQRIRILYEQKFGVPVASLTFTRSF